MRAICRVLGERMFNTCGAPGCPAGVYICGEYRGHITRIRRELSRDYTVCVFVSQRERKRSSSVPRNREYALAYVRVAISGRCARARTGLTGTAIFQAALLCLSLPLFLSLPRCVLSRARARKSSIHFFSPFSRQKLCASHFTEACIWNISAVRGTCIYERMLMRELRFDCRGNIVFTLDSIFSSNNFDGTYTRKKIKCYINL